MAESPAGSLTGEPGRAAVLPRDFFDRPVLDVAPDLLGRVVSHASAAGPVSVRLTEVEAYDGEADPGSHAFRGRTRRNATMFGPPGHLYVYFTYGMHWCMNLVCGPAGHASAVLLRAGEVVVGRDLAYARRPAARGDRDLARGPARLAQALGVDGTLDGVDACDPNAAFRAETGSPVSRAVVSRGPRTGVGGDGADHPWRFWVPVEPTVSPYRAASARPRVRQARGRTPTPRSAAP